MRENLYRGKRVDNGEWVYGLPYKAKYGCISSIVNDDEERFLIFPETVGQYTVLTDKNSKNIFEGDICRVVYLDRRCDSNGKHYEVENVMIEEVVLRKGAFCFKTTVEDIPLYRPIGFDIYEKLKIKDFEVIGNIYDNPELLEVGV